MAVGDEEIPPDEETGTPAFTDGIARMPLRRRTWEEMDALRARMVREGFPLAGLTAAENDRVWASLVRRRRRPQLAALLGMTDTAIDARVATLRRGRALVTGRT